MRQVGVIAAAGIVAIKEMIPFLEEDHRIARMLENKLGEIAEIDVKTDPSSTNMVFWEFRNPKTRNFEDFQRFMLRHNIKINLPWEPKYWFRFVVHHYIREKEVEHIIKAMNEYLNQTNT